MTYFHNISVFQENETHSNKYETLEPGDVIGVTRGSPIALYDHYAIYIGKGQVIHYAGDTLDFGKKIFIHQTPLQNFLKNSNVCFKIVFPKELKVFSPEETILRAKSRLGETKYNLVFNNCEHFALWCKTGISASLQVLQIGRNFLRITKLINKYISCL